jgi:hypothetical protein
VVVVVEVDVVELITGVVVSDTCAEQAAVPISRARISRIDKAFFVIISLDLL